MSKEQTDHVENNSGPSANRPTSVRTRLLQPETIVAPSGEVGQRISYGGGTETWPVPVAGQLFRVLPDSQPRHDRNSNFSDDPIVIVRRMPRSQQDPARTELRRKTFFELKNKYFTAYLSAVTESAKDELCKDLLSIDMEIKDKYRELDLQTLLNKNLVRRRINCLTQTLGILEKYASNLIKPNRPTYWRTLKFTSSLVKTYLENVQGSRDVLRQMGYSKAVVDGLAFPDDIRQPDVETVKVLAADLFLAKCEIDELVHDTHPYLQIRPPPPYQGGVTSSLESQKAKVTGSEPGTSDSDSEYEDAEDGLSAPEVPFSQGSVTSPPASNVVRMTEDRECHVCMDSRVEFSCDDCKEFFCSDCVKTWHRKRPHHKIERIVTPQSENAEERGHSPSTILYENVVVRPVVQPKEQKPAPRLKKPIPTPRRRTPSATKQSATGASSRQNVPDELPPPVVPRRRLSSPTSSASKEAVSTVSAQREREVKRPPPFDYNFLQNTDPPSSQPSTGLFYPEDENVYHSLKMPSEHMYEALGPNRDDKVPKEDVPPLPPTSTPALGPATVPVPSKVSACPGCFCLNEKDVTKCVACGTELRPSTTSQTTGVPSGNLTINVPEKPMQVLAGVPPGRGTTTFSSPIDNIYATICSPNPPARPSSAGGLGVQGTTKPGVSTSTKWECEHCTYHNDMNTKICAVCSKTSDNLKPVDEAPATNLISNQSGAQSYIELQEKELHSYRPHHSVIDPHSEFVKLQLMELERPQKKSPTNPFNRSEEVVGAMQGPPQAYSLAAVPNPPSSKQPQYKSMLNPGGHSGYIKEGPLGLSTAGPSGLSTVRPSTFSTGGPLGYSTGGPSPFSTGGPLGYSTGGPLTFSTVGPLVYSTGGPSPFSTGGPSGYSTGGPSTFSTGGPSGFNTGGPSTFSTGGPSRHNTGGPSTFSTWETGAPRVLNPVAEMQRMKEEGQEFISLLKRAETLGFAPEELNIAYNLHQNKEGPIHWLQNEWFLRMQDVMNKFANVSQNDNLGNLSPQEAREALIEHTGHVEEACTQCVKDRTRKLNEVMESGVYARTNVIKALDDNDGDVTEAIQQLQRVTFEPMLQRIRDSCVPENDNVDNAPQRHRHDSPNQNDEIFEAIVSNKDIDMDRRIRVMFAEKDFQSWGRAKTAIRLIDMDFSVVDSIEAAKQNGDLERSIQFLQRECELCVETKPESHMITMLNCQCRFCKGCVANHFKVVIHEQNIMRLVCPRCSEPTNLEDDAVATEYFNNLDILIRRIVDTETHDLFQRKLRDRTLMKEPNFRWCSHCSSGFINEQPEALKMACPHCKKYTCFQCKKQWEDQHEGITCERFAAWKEANDPEAQANGLAAHLKQNGIECPNCTFRYDLAKGGCMHFKCGQCSHEFCSGCYKPFRNNQHCLVSPACAKRGLHAHHPRDCLFHLRDRDPDELKKLLDDHNVEYNTQRPQREAAENQGFEDDEEVQGAAAPAAEIGRCKVMEQRESGNGLKDTECGRETPEGFAGLCKLHFTEYLVERINSNLIDPVGILNTEDLLAILMRNDVEAPAKAPRENDNAYHNRIVQFVQEKLPLPRNSPRRRVLHVDQQPPPELDAVQVYGLHPMEDNPDNIWDGYNSSDEEPDYDLDYDSGAEESD